MEKSEQGLRGPDIIDALLTNFKDELNREQAEDLLKKIANEIQTQRGVRKSDIKLKNNPGFKTDFLLDKQASTVLIVVDNISDINYLQTLPIYIDSIVRLTQNKKTTQYPPARKFLLLWRFQVQI